MVIVKARITKTSWLGCVGKDGQVVQVINITSAIQFLGKVSREVDVQIRIEPYLAFVEAFASRVKFITRFWMDRGWSCSSGHG